MRIIRIVAEGRTITIVSQPFELQHNAQHEGTNKDDQDACCEYRHRILHETGGHGSDRKEAGEMLDALVSLAYEETKKSGEFTLPGLGKLLKKHREARMGRNPATGESIKIAAKTVVKFRVAKAAKDSIL